MGTLGRGGGFRVKFAMAFSSDRESMRKNWKKILEEIRRRCLEKGSLGVDDVIEIVGPDVHPNYCLQLMSLIAKADPNKFIYEEQRLRARRRPRGGIYAVSYDRIKRVRRP